MAEGFGKLQQDKGEIFAVLSFVNSWIINLNIFSYILMSKYKKDEECLKM